MPQPPAKPSPRRNLILGVAAFAAGAWIFRNPETARTIAIFVVMLSVLIFVHEWGHFQFARWSGMKINRFAVGFPPWLWSRRKNGIIYSIGALPIGGVVDIAGLGSEREMVSHLKGAETQTDSVTADTVDTDSPRGKLFQHTSLGRRFWTLFAGPLMNFIYAMVIFIVIYSQVGVPEPANTNRITEISPKSPAIVAGLQTGDRVVGINAGGTDLKSIKVGEMKDFVRRSGAAVVTMIVQRGDAVLRLPLRRIVMDADPDDEFKDKLGKPLPPAGLGVQFEVITPYRKLGVVQALHQGRDEVVGMWNDTFGLLFRATTFRLTASDRSGVGGPVKIAEMVGQYTVLGWPSLVVLSGVLSVNLAIMNLLPLPALDGGRILFLGYELVAGKPADPKIENRAHAIGLLLLLAFMLFISLRDLLPIVVRAL